MKYRNILFAGALSSALVVLPPNMNNAFAQKKPQVSENISRIFRQDGSVDVQWADSAVVASVKRGFGFSVYSGGRLRRSEEKVEGNVFFRYDDLAVNTFIMLKTEKGQKFVRCDDHPFGDWPGAKYAKEVLNNPKRSFDARVAAAIYLDDKIKVDFYDRMLENDMMRDDPRCVLYPPKNGEMEIARVVYGFSPAYPELLADAGKKLIYTVEEIPAGPGRGSRDSIFVHRLGSRGIERTWKFAQQGDYAGEYFEPEPIPVKVTASIANGKLSMSIRMRKGEYDNEGVAVIFEEKTSSMVRMKIYDVREGAEIASFGRDVSKMDIGAHVIVYAAGCGIIFDRTILEIAEQAGK